MIERRTFLARASAAIAAFVASLFGVNGRAAVQEDMLDFGERRCKCGAFFGKDSWRSCRPGHCGRPQKLSRYEAGTILKPGYGYKYQAGPMGAMAHWLPVSQRPQFGQDAHGWKLLCVETEWFARCGVPKRAGENMVRLICTGRLDTVAPDGSNAVWVVVLPPPFYGNNEIHSRVTHWAELPALPVDPKAVQAAVDWILQK